ncbi:D-lyxose/D-mannose family sugar isomerase [Nesterenkonia flava]|uniref:D-lyxose ketol-isomerase n=1 Tax=Nesterenkonia flava TaxID=469799 RepID=A0ABU1FUE0_9MICC|nr:D-lyxose/D-mannose family sugar isomerase [Nesterenkonia flava]MDR5712284.1 D-lyxose/D-mannose family sugar isomerase [Nesterenkonia flava]
MKRSEIESIIAAAKALAEAHRFELPPTAAWSRQDWREHKEQARLLIERGIGWDVTDFGGGDFARRGLCLYTLRNGSLADRDRGEGQTYAEKFMSVGVGQETPFHLHQRKAEDIINRGGGELVLEVRPAEGKQLGDAPMEVLVDGLPRTVGPQEQVRLAPGQSIHLPTGVFHRFWAEGSQVLAGEVSGVNDDDADNVFLEELPRFSEVEEDVDAVHLLVSEYKTAL